MIKEAIKIGLLTSIGVIMIHSLSVFVAYNFFSFEMYASIVAVVFLLTGYYLVPARKSTELPGKNIIQNLTGREMVVFRLLALGKSNKEIASVMAVEVSTVKTHTNNLYAKIGCKNRIDARNLWLKLNSENH